MAERLLPGTDAIPANTIEWTKYRGKHLLRYKLDRINCRLVQTPDAEEAATIFFGWIHEMREKAASERGK
jgi:hypothetical protein